MIALTRDHVAMLRAVNSRDAALDRVKHGSAPMPAAAWELRDDGLIEIANVRQVAGVEQELLSMWLTTAGRAALAFYSYEPAYLTTVRLR
jgi:hypothetical protein